MDFQGEGGSQIQKLKMVNGSTLYCQVQCAVSQKIMPRFLRLTTVFFFCNFYAENFMIKLTHLCVFFYRG